jgi:hypothetical protein
VDHVWGGMAESAKATNVCIIHMLCFNILQRGLSTSPQDVYMSDAVMRGLLACSPAEEGSTQAREQGTVRRAHPLYQCSPDYGAQGDPVLSAATTHVEPQAQSADLRVGPADLRVGTDSGSDSRAA